MAMRRMFPQPDLFETPPRGWCSRLRSGRSWWISYGVLLMQAMATPQASADAQERWEASDDEDHA
jgi:hypothetical protein